MEKYILNYIREHSDDELMSHYIDLFKNDLDKLLYGNNTSFSGRNCFVSFSKYNMWKGEIRYILNKFTKSHQEEPLNENSKNVLTTNAFGADEDFRKYDILLFSTDPRSLLRVINDKPFRDLRKAYASMLRSGSFHGMLKKENLERLDFLQDGIAKVLVKNKIKAFFTNNDDAFWNKYLIEVCRKVGIPSFEFLHGFPAYTKDINTRTDYLCVWGDKIKKNFIQNGFNGDRIFVTGTPHFSISTKRAETLRNSFDDVLVATSLATMYLQHGWIMDEYGDQNSSLLILYIYQIEHVLRQLGVKHARLRPHPSVDKLWLSKYIDMDFYSLDYESVNDSLNRSTMVIGPHSTLMIDALCNGVNYYVYEPGENGVTIRGAKLAPPSDGRDEWVRVAQSEKELIENIRGNNILDPRFLDGYLQPFSLTPIMDLF